MVCVAWTERETERSIMLASGVILGHGATTNEKKAKSQAVQLKSGRYNVNPVSAVLSTGTQQQIAERHVNPGHYASRFRGR